MSLTPGSTLGAHTVIGHLGSGGMGEVFRARDTTLNGEGVWEARVMLGPGYRIYFGKDSGSIIVLLIGGDKGSQAKDIARARGFWRDYREAKRHGKAT